MFPDFFDIFGVDLYGRSFELVLWLLGVALGLWVLVECWRHLRARRRDHVILYGGVGLLLWGLSLPLAWRAWTDPMGYSLVFREELVVTTYALMTLLGFGVGAWLSAREGVKQGIPRWRIFDLAFWSLIAGIAGARLTFIVTSYDQYVDACVDPGAVGLSAPDCLRVFKFWEGGQVFYGSFLGAGLLFVYYARRHKLDFAQLVDLAAPSLALGHAIGRVGCLAAGCCWGDVCASGWGLRFDTYSMPYEDQVSRLEAGDVVIDPHILVDGLSMPVHPTQIYDGVAELMIFAFLLLWRRRRRVRGELLAWWLLLYGVARTLIEFTRGDHLRGHLWEWRVKWINALFAVSPSHVTMMSTSQVVGIVMGAVGAGGLLWLRRREDARWVSGGDA